MAFVRKTKSEEPGRRREASAPDPRSDRPHLAPVEGDGEKRPVGLETVVGPVLRFGSLLSTLIILVGIGAMVWSFRFAPVGSPGPAGVEYRPALHTPLALLAGVEKGDPMAIVSVVGGAG